MKRRAESPADAGQGAGQAAGPAEQGAGQLDSSDFDWDSLVGFFVDGGPSDPGALEALGESHPPGTSVTSFPGLEGFHEARARPWAGCRGLDGAPKRGVGLPLLAPRPAQRR